MDNNVYYKDNNGRYKPFGVRIGENYIPDGIYYIRHTEFSKSTTNVDRYLSGIFKVGDSEVIDCPKLCRMQDYVDYILQSKELKEIENKRSYTLYELIAKIVALVFNYNKKLENGNH